MIILLHGNAFHKRREKLEKIISSLKRKRPTSEVFSMNADEDIGGRLDELIHGAGLFDEKHIVVLRNFFQKEETREPILRKIDKMADSPNVFIVLEDGIKATQLKKLSGKAHFTEGFFLTQRKSDTSDLFSFTDAIGEKNSSKAWKIFNESLFLGREAEELYRLALWMIKTVQASKVSGSVKDAGVKPFSYNKAKRYGNNFTKQELQEHSLFLLEASQKDRAGGTPLRFSLEKMLLDL